MEVWSVSEYSGRLFCRLDLETGEGVRALVWRKLVRDRYWWVIVNVRDRERYASGSSLDRAAACEAAESAARALGLL